MRDEGTFKEKCLMSLWQLVFLQSRVNHRAYEDEGLEIYNWAWPRGTWFQKRLRLLRENRRPARQLKAH